MSGPFAQLPPTPELPEIFLPHSTTQSITEPDLTRQNPLPQTKAHVSLVSPTCTPISAASTDEKFGNLPLCDSTLVTARTWAEMTEITPQNSSKQVWLRVRLQTIRRKGKICFLQLRDRMDTCQACVFVGENDDSLLDLIRFASKIPIESWVDVYGTILKTRTDVKWCTIKDAEVLIEKLFVVSASTKPLPFYITDAKQIDSSYIDSTATSDLRNEPKNAHPIIPQSTRLDNRHVDLRTPANQAIFTIQSRIGQYFRECMHKQGFLEIFTPKISKPDALQPYEVFPLEYWGTQCCLARSPQMYHQIAAVADFGKVYEVSHVFRAQNANTHRHLCEYTGLNVEMTIKEDYHEVLEVIEECLVFIIQHLILTCEKELSTINAQYPTRPLRLTENVPRLTFEEATSLLMKRGEDCNGSDCLLVSQERRLGELVLEQYDSDLYVIDQLPAISSSFTTMQCSTDPRCANAYKIYLRGQSIASGAQRVHDVEVLKANAKDHRIALDSIQSYISTFQNGALPHAGCGIGLERLTSAVLGLKNIRQTSMFPRDPHRCAP